MNNKLTASSWLSGVSWLMISSNRETSAGRDTEWEPMYTAISSSAEECKVVLLLLM